MTDELFDLSDCACVPCDECGALHGHWSGCAQSTDPDAEITREWRRPALVYPPGTPFLNS